MTMPFYSSSLVNVNNNNNDINYNRIDEQRILEIL